MICSNGDGPFNSSGGLALIHHPHHMVHSAGGAPAASMPVPHHTEFHQPHVLVPANPYLYEEIPYWLHVYSKAAPEYDHKLRWELFRLPELDCYDNVLKRLYKQELETIVMNYEAYRSAVAREIERRTKQAQYQNSAVQHQHQQRQQQQQQQDHRQLLELKEKALAQELETKV